MSKQEFLETLRRALARELSESEVADNINYYWNYIEQQIAGGKTEEEVLNELGDPRLIARTILQVDQKKTEDDAAQGYREAVYSDDSDEDYREDSGSYGGNYEDPFRGTPFEGSVHVRKMGVRDWIRLILVVAVVGLILVALFRALWIVLPYLLIAGLVFWLYRKISGR